MLFNSCVGTKKLYNGLTKESSTLEYLYDSKFKDGSKTDTIKINKPLIVDLKLTKSGNLKKIKASTLPLIIYTSWKSEHTYSVGQNVIKEDISDFVRKTLINEFCRSSSIFADSTSNSNFELQIEIDSIGAHGPYYSNGSFLYLLLVYSYSIAEYAGPGIAYSKLNYQLKNREQILKQGTFKKEIATEPLKNNFQSTKELRKFYSSQLTEALSFTLKTNIEAIVNEIDNYLYNTAD